jgi:hypothetical protein
MAEEGRRGVALHFRSDGLSQQNSRAAMSIHSPLEHSHRLAMSATSSILFFSPFLPLPPILLLIFHFFFYYNAHPFFAESIFFPIN